MSLDRANIDIPIPDTGDNSNLMLSASVLVLSLAALTALLAAVRKRRNAK